MSFTEIFTGIGEKIKSLFEQIKDFYQENKIKSLIICALFVLILLLLIVLFCILGSDKNKKIIKTETDIILSETPLVPKSPELQEDYSFSRLTKDKWTEEDANEWFTIPSNADIESLSKSNDLIISEITGAAP